MTTKERLEELLEIIKANHWTREEELIHLIWILIRKEAGE